MRLSDIPREYWVAAGLLTIGIIVVFYFAGCTHPGSGFLGGQGISIHATEDSHIEHVTIHINDGGFAVPNPLQRPTTRPKE
ncbi:MAG: hypothetical protein H8E73_09225 [Planctomycetes bacterium]|nr:hypothetical protein [Planctomycetota bacterium]